MSRQRHGTVTRIGDGKAMAPLILCVEDELDLSTLVRLHLERAGFAVETALTGYAAIEAVRQHRPDLILLDLMLPDIDGFSVCELLRRQPENATIPIVIMSAWAAAETRALGFELGALEYLQKPVRLPELVARLKLLLGHRLLSA